MKRFTAIDVCSGCGGLSIGLRRGGFDVLLGFDIDYRALHTYELNRRHHGARGVHLDLETATATKVRGCLDDKKVQIDLVAGCPPCQGFSRIRTKNGHAEIQDDRKSLVAKYISLAVSLDPSAILMENVPGLAHTPEFDSAVQTLRSSGYDAQWCILDAADYGVPQHRDRLVLIASRIARIELARPAKVKKTVRCAIGELPPAGASGDRLHDHLSIHSPLVQQRIKSIPPDGGSRSDLPLTLQLECHKDNPGFRDVYGRMRWDAPSPTITGGCTNPSKGRFLHPVEHRAITLREALLLQGFPKRFTLPPNTSKQDASQMIGNAFPPPFAAAQARSIARVLKGA